MIKTKIKRIKDYLRVRIYRTRLVKFVRIRSYSDEELKTRLNWAQEVVKYVIKEGDPYGVVDKYREQVRRLSREIQRRRRRSSGKPERTEVKLKVGKLSGRT